MAKFKHLEIALEAIEFQSGSFFKELALNLEPYFVKNNGLTKEEQHTLGDALDRVILKHVGMKSKVEFTHFGTCVYVPDITARHILGNDWGDFLSAKDGMKMIEHAGENNMSVGIVDLKRSRLSGDFSKYEVVINVDLMFFRGRFMSASECAAVILHEIGHWFTYCELMDRVITGNMLLEGLNRVLAGGDASEKEIAIKKVADIVEMDDLVFQDLQKSTSDKAVITVFITHVGKKAASREGHSFYDSNTWEMLSDQFAARHGAGRHVVTALDKVFSRFGSRQRDGSFLYYFGEIMKLSSGLFFIATAAISLVNIHVVLASILLLGYSYFAITLAYQEDGTPVYDKPKDRFLRVRRQLIEQVKNTNLSIEVVKSLAEDVKVIDEVISDYTERANWLESIDNFLFKSSRRRRDNTNLQRDIEKLAMNDLFLSAATLRTI
jgi:hypothetical protein